MRSTNKFLLLFLLATFYAVKIIFATEDKSSARWDGTYIKALFSRPLTFDPAQMNDTSSLIFSNLIYDGLLSFSPDLEIQPALARSWHVAKEGKLLIFQLRDDVKFHDGTPITASAVVSSLRRLVRPGSKVFIYYDCIAGAKDYFDGRSTSVRGIRALGDSVVEIELEYPFPPFMSVLAGATAKVLPTSAETDPQFFKRPVGSGAFVYSRANASGNSRDIILEAFDSYYGGSPKIRKLILKELSAVDAVKLAQAYQVHDLASYAFNFNGDETLFDKGQRFDTTVAATWIIGLNTRLEPFNRIEVRRAFIASIDSNDFRKRFYSNALAANGYIPPGLPGFRWSYDDPARPNPGVPAKIHGAIKKVRLYVPMELIKGREIAEYLTESARKVGFSVEVVLSKWPDLWKGYNDKSLQAFLFSMNIDYPDTEFLVRNFESTNPDNFSGLKDAKIDDLIRRARAIPDKTARQKLYVRLVKLLNDMAVTVNLLHPRDHYWVHPCVRGFQPNLLADVYINYRNIVLDESCLTKLAREN